MNNEVYQVSKDYFDEKLSREQPLRVEENIFRGKTYVFTKQKILEMRRSTGEVTYLLSEEP